MLFLKKLLPNAFWHLFLMAGMFAVLLSGCGQSLPENAHMRNGEYLQPKIRLTTADLETDCASPVCIDLDGITEELCLITKPGCYVLSGELKGTVRIDAEDQMVHLVLNGATVDSVHGSALEVMSAGKVIVTLQENTENTLQDSGAYPKDTDADACLFSQCDLTINGSGALNVYGYHKDAVHTKDMLKILGGNLFVQSKRDGLRGNDGIVINGSTIDVQSEENGIRTTKTGKETKGNIEIYDSICSVIGGKYAVSGAADLYIADSTVSAMGILGNIRAEGISSIAEGSLDHEQLSP